MIKGKSKGHWRIDQPLCKQQIIHVKYHNSTILNLTKWVWTQIGVCITIITHARSETNNNIHIANSNKYSFQQNSLTVDCKNRYLRNPILLHTTLYCKKWANNVILDTEQSNFTSLFKPVTADATLLQFYTMQWNFPLPSTLDAISSAYLHLFSYHST